MTADDPGQRLLDALPVPLFFKDADGVYRRCNRAFCDFLALSPDDILGHTVHDVAPPERARTYAEADAALLAEGPGGTQQYVAPVVTSSGEERAVAFTKACYTDADGRVAGIVGLVFDVTSRERTSTDLRAYAERFRVLLERSPIAMAITREDGTIRYANPRLAELLDEMPDAMTGRNAVAYYQDSARRRELIEKVDRDGRVREEEVALRTAEGDARHVLMTMERLAYEGETVLIVWMYDITGRKHMEEALRAARRESQDALERAEESRQELLQAEKMASLGHLVAGVTHELNTPIGNTLSGASLLDDEAARIQARAAEGSLKRSDLNGFLETVRETSQLMTRNIHRAGELIGSFKEVAVDQAHDERRTFDLATYLEEIAASLRPRVRKAGHTLTFECPAGIVMEGYPGALFRIFGNLVTNALMHAFGDTPGGHIDLTVTPPADGAVTLTFRDDGRGMDADEKARIFDPYFTTRRGSGGSGLGLSIVHSLVTRNLGGEVTVASTPGHGTTTTLTLPLTAPENAPEP